jgi:hypothetical protein
MSDPDTVVWVDAAGTAYSPLNMPALDAPQRTIYSQWREASQLFAPQASAGVLLCRAPHPSLFRAILSLSPLGFLNRHAGGLPDAVMARCAP